MIKVALILTLFLGGCTIARYGEDFEKQAVHIEKDYNKPFDELYGCFMSKFVLMAPGQSTYSTSTTAVYEYNGFMKMVLTKAGPKKAHVRASALTPQFKPETIIHGLDVCAGLKSGV